MSYLALARKWRPKQFSEVVGQSFVVQALSNALTQNHLHHAYLFTGTRGVGKTTIARILAKCLNCETGITATPCDQCSHCQEIDSGRFPDLFEIDAASRTKVEDTRDILDNVQYAPTTGRFKIYLIDEVHMLSGHSFNALLKTLEEPPEHVKFLLATTDPQKLPATVLSRCLQFHLSHVSTTDIQQQLQHILTQEHIAIDTNTIQLIADAANGSLRDALSLLDQALAFGNGTLSAEDTRQMLGSIDQTYIRQLLTALANQDANTILDISAQLQQQGCDFSKAIAELLKQLHTLTRIQLAPQKTDSAELSKLAANIAVEDVQLYYQIGLIGQRDLPFAPTAQSGFEMTLLRMLAFTPQHNAEVTTAPTPIKARQEIPKAHPTQAVNTNSWYDIYQRLQLTGAARMLAEQCSLINQTESSITLGIEQKHKALLQPALIERLKTALASLFGRAMALTISEIDIGNVDNDTPAKAQARIEQQRQQQAEQDIYNDAKVQQIIQTFDAKIVKESIKPTT